MRKKKSAGVGSSVTSPVTSPVMGNGGRQFRDKLTRVMSPIKGKDTNAKQWGRWTP